MHRFLLLGLLLGSTANAQSLALTAKGGLPDCQLELDDSYELLDLTVSERDAAREQAVINGLSEFMHAAVIARIRKRPDLLLQEWDQLADESIELLRQNPKYLPVGTTAEQFEAAAARLRDGQKQVDPLEAVLEQTPENRIAVDNPTFESTTTTVDNVLRSDDAL